jgi:hypothetical protein
VDVAGDFDLLAQGQALDSTDDGFDDGHTVAKISIYGRGARVRDCVAASGAGGTLRGLS